MENIHQVAYENVREDIFAELANIKNELKAAYTENATSADHLAMVRCKSQLLEIRETFGRFAK